MTGEGTSQREFGKSVVVLVAGDITQVPADAIVNAANDAFRHGGGVDGALRAAAGPELSGEMRQRYPSGTPTGTVVATSAYALPARWVIHAVGPVWGMPAISGGTFGFPIDAVADVALRTVRDHLLGETRIERVTFVLRNDAIVAFGRRLRTL